MHIRNSRRLFSSLILVVLLLSLFSCASSDRGAVRPSDQRVFETQEEAVEALVAAFKSEDPEQMVAIFGEKGRDVLVTGDPVADRLAFRRISRRFAERAELINVDSHEFSNEAWYKVRIGIMGLDMRVPLVNRGSGWVFATEYGLRAAKATRLAINEMTAVDTLLALVKAQRAYKAQDVNGDGVSEYARRIISTQGKRDGLYWPKKPWDQPSPLNELVTQAYEDGYRSNEQTPSPYEGYMYKILEGQGRQARGGPRNYVVDGRMVNGFAFLAYPVEWNSSGAWSYLVTQDGRVFKKNLGSRTESIGEDMTEVNDDRTWVRVDNHIGVDRSRTRW